jgi:hypothetical protein
MNLNFHASMEGLDPCFDSEEKLLWNGSEGGDEEGNDYSDAAVVVAFLVVGSSTALEVVSAV